MKPISVLCIAMMASKVNAGSFDNEKGERRIETECIEQRQETIGWQIVAGILGIGTVIRFTVGAAVRDPDGDAQEAGRAF